MHPTIHSCSCSPPLLTTTLEVKHRTSVVAKPTAMIASCSLMFPGAEECPHPHFALQPLLEALHDLSEILDLLANVVQ